MFTVTLLTIAMLGPTNPQLTGAYEMEEMGRVSTLHIVEHADGEAQGWLVQETKEESGTTRWYARVNMSVNEDMRFSLVIDYQKGEKEGANGAREEWDMRQEREERGRLLSSGDLKILPDRWKRVGTAEEPPTGKGVDMTTRVSSL